MQRLWVIPLVIFVLLLGAWFFRWEKGPTQSEEGLKIVHSRDRWTGQRWFALYGRKSEKLQWEEALSEVPVLGTKKVAFYSGEEYPHFENGVIEIRASQILSSPIGQARKKELENQLSAAKQKKILYSQGHTQYLRLEEQLSEQAKSLIKAKERNYNGLVLPDWSHVFEVQKRRDEYVHSKIPLKLSKECEAWREADRQVSAIESEIQKLPQWAEKQAKKQLTAEAYRNRNIATTVWGSLVGISLLASVVPYIRSYRSDKNNH